MWKKIHKIYSLMDEETLDLRTVKAYFFKVLYKIGLIREKEFKDNKLDFIAEFTEYPECDYCGSVENYEVLRALDGNRVVACRECGLWRTSPRIPEEIWIAYLKKETERSRLFTENRLKYGVALDRNIKFSTTNYFSKLMKKEKAILDIIEKTINRPISAVHDVGCGVGFLMMAAQKKRIKKVTGNELNGYAVKVMQKRFGLEVYNEELHNLNKIPWNKYDAVIMSEFIEHAYHPKREMKMAYNLLKESGALYISTFFIDSSTYKKLGDKWDMFCWNHTYHFSSITLKRHLRLAGFKKIVAGPLSKNVPGYLIGIK